jgi:hypothetical protein
LFVAVGSAELSTSMALYTMDQKLFAFKSWSYSGGSWRLYHRESSVLVAPSRHASGLFSRSKKQDASVIDVRRDVKFGICVGVEVLFWDVTDFSSTVRTEEGNATPNKTDLCSDPNCTESLWCWLVVSVQNSVEEAIAGYWNGEILRFFEGIRESV